MATENKRMLQLAGADTDWASNPQTPLTGEIAVELDGANSRFKIGDGVNAYAALNFASRRTSTEFDTDGQTLIDGQATDVSTGVGSAGFLAKLDAAGLLDVSMLPAEALVQGSVRFFGEADFTATPPAAPAGGYTAGDIYFNSQTGVIEGGWGATLDGKPTFAGDMMIYDTAPWSNWRWIPGSQFLDLQSRNFTDDTNAGGGGVPLGGLYHNAGAVRVKIT